MLQSVSCASLLPLVNFADFLLCFRGLTSLPACFDFYRLTLNTLLNCCALGSYHIRIQTLTLARLTPRNVVIEH